MKSCSSNLSAGLLCMSGEHGQQRSARNNCQAAVNMLQGMVQTVNLAHLCLTLILRMLKHSRRLIW